MDRYSKKDQKSNLIKIRPIGAEQFNADGRIEEWKNMTKVIVAFRNSANPTKNLFKNYHRKGQIRCIGKMRQVAISTDLNNWKPKLCCVIARLVV